ncbi:GTP pyrophosphokinase [Paenibacillus sp. NAIST15-1]|uniref:GTP pyrophosphokinase n=1 Tax=Paenibacillus sp. NAIST15-1 TaxID=1605994 RepID=UPI00086AD61F|nr:GTP pyrophosphokinase [Paenibacillus sp. NAIST15-1]GAV11429.1 HD domain protein [Paenibacillus sp. NAIST15-1]
MSSLTGAIIIAAKAHLGQVDKGGNPYILHPLRVMDKVQGEEAKIVAVLHDVVEDTYVTAEDLLIIGFSKEILTSIDCLTRKKDESYMEFIRRAKLDLIARQVKIADIEDNMDLSRLKKVTEEDIKRNKKYEKSLKILTLD